jgi:hypothetical protein
MANSTDNWTWRVVYTDGSTLDEHDEAGVPRGFASVELSRVRTVMWLPLRSDRQGYAVRIDVTAGQRPILFRRRRVLVNLTTDAQEDGGTIHCIGYQQTVRGVNVSSYLFIYPDGSALLSDDQDAGIPLL